MEENDVKKTLGETRLEFKVEKDEKFFIQNQTRRKKYSSKSNALYFFSIQNMTNCKTFKSKSDALYFFILKFDIL